MSRERIDRGRQAATTAGNKGHIAADRSGIVKDDRFSGAAQHDSNCIDELTEDERRMVVADSAYRSYEREPGLESRGVCGAFAFKRPRAQPDLPPMLKKLNRLIAGAAGLLAARRQRWC